MRCRKCLYLRCGLGTGVWCSCWKEARLVVEVVIELRVSRNELEAERVTRNAFDFTPARDGRIG